MRKSVIPVAAAIAMAVSYPAHAVKFQCSFLNGSSVTKQCDIESGASGAGWYCQQSYSQSLDGLCYVLKASSSSDRLQCHYENPTGTIEERTRVSDKADVKLLSEQQGFIAGGVTLGDSTKLVLTAGYRESATAPLFQVTCTPKP